MILLDTDTVVAHLRGNSAVTSRILEKVTEIALPAITLAEPEYGALISQKPEENLRHLHNLVNSMEVISFDRDCAAKYGEIKAKLKLTGKMSGEVDVFIAAIALARNAALITHNLKHFEAMGELKLEDGVV